MKITALISDELIHVVKKTSQGKNITHSLTIAINEWVETKKIKILKVQPLVSGLNFLNVETLFINT
jgi:hypothetical protein